MVGEGFPQGVANPWGMDTSRRSPSLRTAVVASAVSLLGVLAVPSSAAPDGVPDIAPGLAEPVERGDLIVTELPAVTPTAKTVDGDTSDWVGTPIRISGGSHYDRGELLHTDFLWDAYGADRKKEVVLDYEFGEAVIGEVSDVERWELFGSAFYEETRANRLDDLLRTSGSQLGVPEPIGASDNYGDSGDLNIGDITDLRLAADDEDVFVLVRTANMADPDDLVVLLLADTDPAAGSTADPALGLPDDHRYDVVLEISTDPAIGAPDGVAVAGDATDYVNAVEISAPASTLAPDGVLDLAVVTARVDGETGNLVPLNIAFRHVEPVDIYNDRMQAFALHGSAPEGSHIDLFSSGPVDLADLRSGRTQSARPGPGYHERHFDSGDNISTESGRDGRSQPYGIFVPTDFDPAAVTPLTFWLHYRGGKAHSGATISPRLIHDLAQEDPNGLGLSPGPGNLVITPHARGTSYWYVSRSHQDFFEVFDDAHGLFPNIDPTRRYLAGYSMGGYGTYLMAALYPHLFAGGYSTSGAVTQGAWTGVKDSELCDFGTGSESPCFIEANSGDASAQLTHRILDNVRHVPIHIDHGTNDELVPISGVQLQAARLVELGYRVQMQTFPGYEHFTQAALDEYAEGSRYLQRFRAPENPRHVTYRVVPALVRALNTVRLAAGSDPFDFQPDGAYWVDDLVVRDGDETDPTSTGLIDVVAERLDATPYLTVPVTGAVAPGHSSPFTRHGLDWLDDPTGTTSLRNGFVATLTDVASVTLDAERMQLDASAVDGRASTLRATITTDGPATVTLDRLGPGTATLTCDCGEEEELDWATDDLDLDLTRDGVWTLTGTTEPEPEETETDPSTEPTDPSTEPTDPATEPSEEATDEPEPTDEPEDEPTEEVPGETRRIAGNDRVATALALSREGFDEASTVLLARADDYPDALTGAPLAVQLQSPILLTDTERLSPGVADEIARLGATDVVVLGGTQAVSAQVGEALRGRGLTVARLAGTDRFDTAARIAARLDASSTAVVVEGRNADPLRGWPDAVSVAPVAARRGSPILLTDRDTVPDVTLDALRGRDVTEVTVVGGTVAVSSAAVAQVAEVADVTRIAGATRYDTALRVAASFPATTDTTWLATGRTFADALTAGPVVALRGDRLLLIDGQDVGATDPVLDALSPGDDVRIVGGTAAISARVQDAVRARVA